MKCGVVITSGAAKEFVARAAERSRARTRAAYQAHRRGVADPMSASLLRVPGNGNTFVPQACQRTIAVFDAPHALRSAARLQASLDTVKADAVTSGHRRGLLGRIRSARGAHPRACRHQLPDGIARHRGVARADRRDAGDGSYGSRFRPLSGRSCPGDAIGFEIPPPARTQAKTQ